MAYRIDGNKLEVLRAKLIQKFGRDVWWTEFAALTGVSLTTISNIRHGRSDGSGQTGQQIIDAFAKEGILVSHEDLISDSNVPRKAQPRPRKRPSQTPIHA